MEWGAFASTARSKGLRFLIDCDVAEASGQHETEGCLAHGRYVRAILPDPYNECGPRVILSADEVIAHMGDGIHDWGTRTMIERLDALRICPPGLINSPALSGVTDAYNVLALEGLSEQFSVLPASGGLNDQPHGIIEAFSVIRGARNMVENRRLKEINRASGG